MILSEKLLELRKRNGTGTRNARGRTVNTGEGAAAVDTLTKNLIFEGEVTGCSSEGHGVCRHLGRAVFVPGALSGELVRVRVVKVTASVAYGRLEEVLTPSPGRETPSCPVFGKCGGCGLLHMSYDEEKRFKLARVNDALQRIGGLDLRVTELFAAPGRGGYRNKAIYNVAAGPVSGFFRRRTHEVVPIERCAVQPECCDRAAAAVRAWMTEHRVPAYDEATGEGCVRHIFTRLGFATGELQVTLVTARVPKAADALVPLLRAACPELHSLVLCLNTTRGNTVLSGSLRTLWGSDTITDRLCGLYFELSPFSFYQINPGQAERLYNRALEYAVGGGELGTALDLYCGAGTISLCLARGAKRVIGAEIVPSAVSDARENARRNGVENAEFICADAGKAARELAKRGIRPDAVVVDPPRKGLSPEVIDTVAGMAPRRVVYVSCNPATLARDLARFTSLGYAPAAATAVDMFPGTSHVETVALLSKG